MSLFKKILAYIVCLSMPKSIEDAINEAASVDELDERVLEKAGFAYERKKRKSADRA